MVQISQAQTWVMMQMKATVSTTLLQDNSKWKKVTALCNTMDELDSFLDDLEQKNDSLNAKLKALLASMKEEENGDTQAETTEVKKDDGK
ncbi:hypothetical protein HOLleu_16201 [Holothuria leucospilota]|uniref:Uncharacterized protein n=1 Tax=Holothuria leucospilota TaxID=206669 RepID=A0A9Q1C3R3_HOLLE|nr:hypothetical protein HOLleu_16201 [Holothuria leucospilota]